MIDGYAISTNRGVDVLKYIAIPKYDRTNQMHIRIASISKCIHLMAKSHEDIHGKEKELAGYVKEIFIE